MNTRETIIRIIKSAFNDHLNTECWDEGEGVLQSEITGKEDFFEAIEQELTDLFDNQEEDEDE